MEKTIFRIQKMVFYCYIYICDSLGLYPRGVFQMLYDFFLAAMEKQQEAFCHCRNPRKAFLVPTPRNPSQRWASRQAPPPNPCTASGCCSFHIFPLIQLILPCSFPVLCWKVFSGDAPFPASSANSSNRHLCEASGQLLPFPWRYITTNIKQ